MAENSVSDGRRDAILADSDLLVSWCALVLFVGIIITALIGAMIGAKVVKKHIAADRMEEQLNALSA